MIESKPAFIKDLELRWNISEDMFPYGGPFFDKAKFFLNYAILAPSSHNTQPWLFNIDVNAIELYADRTRALSVVDPEDRELTISCGAALFHLILAIRHFGYSCRIEFFAKDGSSQQKRQEDLLARVYVDNWLESRPNTETRESSPNTQQKQRRKEEEEEKNQEEEESSLFKAIVKRRTNRLKFEDRDIPESILSKLQFAVSGKSLYSEGSAPSSSTWLYLVTKSYDESKMNSIANLIAEGDRIQMSDKRFKRELASWIHPNRNYSKDGIPGYAFGYGDIMSLIGPFVIRTFDTGKGQAAKDRDLATGSPVLGVLGTKSDKPLDWLVAGMTLANMLLLARSHNIWCSFLNQPIEVAELRNKVREVTGKEGFPQLLMRLGYFRNSAKEEEEDEYNMETEILKPTPRRPLKEVIMPD
jgi:Nitroreductase family